MIKSMTGFGKGEAVVGDKKFRVELRSLNSKQLDLSIKIPSKYRAAEAEVRSIVTRELQRGKVDCFVMIKIKGRSKLKNDNNLLVNKVESVTGRKG